MKEEEEDINEVREAAVSYRRMNEEAYLEWESTSTNKHEYYRGEVFAMAGASTAHLHISSNVLIMLGMQLKGKDCFPFGSDLRVHIPKNTLYTYPDITIVCNEMETINDGECDNLLNPSVIIEILSKSTRKYDQGLKFNLYKDIASLQEYILIDSEKVAVQQFIRDEHNNWALTRYQSPEDSFTVKQVNATLSISGVYERTRLL